MLRRASGASAGRGVAAAIRRAYSRRHTDSVLVLIGTASQLRGCSAAARLRRGGKLVLACPDTHHVNRNRS